MSSDRRIDGMWIIPAERLLLLDQIIEEECTDILARANETLESAIRKARGKAKARGDYDNLTGDQRKRFNAQLRQEYKAANPIECQSIITVSDDKDAEHSAGKVAELVNRPELAGRRIVSLKVRVQCFSTACEFTLPSSGRFNDSFLSSYPKSTTVWHHGRESDSRLALRLHDWLRESRAPRLYLTWRQFHPWCWFILIFLAAVSLAIVDSTTPKPSYKDEARRLLDSGLTDRNQLQALGLVLRIAAGIPAPDSNLGMVIPPWFWSLLVVGVAICGFVWWHPTDTIGIGKGETTIRRRAATITWAKWVLGTIILGGLLVSVAGNLLSDLLKRFYTRIMQP